MSSFIIRRLLQVIPTVFFAISFLFFLFFVLPGDPATLIAGGAQPHARSRRRRSGPTSATGSTTRCGVQFVDYWERVLHWDLGESFVNDRSVNDILYEKAPRSIRLAIWATLIEIIVGISVGLISAVRRYSLTDKATTLGTTAAAAIPVFVLGFILQYVFAVLPERARLAGVDAAAHVAASVRTRGSLFFIPIGEQWRYLILPAITLACVSTALAARMMRGSMLEVLHADYIRTARSKGLGERSVVLRHGLRNALIPVVTLIGIDFGAVIGAAVLTETVFSWPGIGSQIVDSVERPRPPGDPRPHAGRRDHLLARQPARRPVVRLVRPAHPPRGASRVDEDRSWRRVLAATSMAVFGLAASSILPRAHRHRSPTCIAPYSYRGADAATFRVGPSRDHWFGTDTVGRDLFSRVVYGARDLAEGRHPRHGAWRCSSASRFGAIAGFFGGGTDSLLMRIVDIFLSIPYIILAIAIATLFGRSVNSLIIVLGLTGWLAITRIVRASFLSLKKMEYAEAARALGFGRTRIIFGHLLPNASVPIIVYGTIAIGGGDPVRGGAVVPRRRAAVADAGVGADGRRGRRGR